MSIGHRWLVSVDQPRCLGSGICAALAPDHFSLVDGVSGPATSEVDPGNDAVVDAAESCPVEAITVRGTDGTVRAPLP
jgi:ferredoxin